MFLDRKRWWAMVRRETGGGGHVKHACMAVAMAILARFSRWTKEVNHRGYALVFILVYFSVCGQGINSTSSPRSCSYGIA